MPTTPPADAPLPPRERLAQLRDTYGTLIIYGAALLFGVLLMPLLVWVVGNRLLGPYTHGQNTHAGPLALLADFLVGLGHGSAVFWAVALGPAIVLLLVRLLLRLVRALSSGQGE
jgi:ABC-type Fe3+-siderophore transport system permease subunit